MELMIERPVFAAAPTLVGSVPHTEPQRLMDRILGDFAELPAWPQMPARDWFESMYVQYSEGLPGAVVERSEQRIYFRGDEVFYRQLEEFYEAVAEDDVERFAITPEYALGLYLFLDQVPRLGSNGPQWVKGQVTGPFSFAMAVTDENQRPLAYHPELCEVAVEGMTMKARWLARRLREVAGGVLVVLDEPRLCCFGSGFVNMPRNDVIAAIDGAVAAIHQEGALAGLHCCGNADWSLALSTAVDVVNFDACEYFQGLSLYPGELSAFLRKGGILGWGIVPASRSSELDPQALLNTLKDRVRQLAAKGVDRGRLYRQALLTPSCGLGRESVERADRVMEALVELSKRVREREGLGRSAG